MRIIKGVLVKVWEEPKSVSYSGLACLHKMMGGYVESAVIDKNVMLYCHFEGKVLGLPSTRKLRDDPIAGNFVIVGFDEYGEEISLTDEQIEKYIEQFKEIKETKYTFDGTICFYDQADLEPEKITIKI